MRIAITGLITAAVVMIGAGCKSPETRRWQNWFDAGLAQRAHASGAEEIVAADESLRRIHKRTVDSEIEDAAEAEDFFSALGGVVSALPIPAAQHSWSAWPGRLPRHAGSVGV